MRDVLALVLAGGEGRHWHPLTRERTLGIMRNATAMNTAFFNTQRMLLQVLYAACMDHREDCR